MTKIYKCFIGSPSDTSVEREICDKVFEEINTTIGESMDFRIESKKWEKDVFPAFGADSQDVINKQIGSDYNIFVGIMWKKFGTPTSRAESGTEEEFLNAHKLWEKNKDIDLMFYFNKEAVELDEIDTDQLKKVKQFSKKVADLGGLYYQYNGASQFEADFKKHIQKILLNKVKCTGRTIDLKENLRIKELFENRFKESLQTYSSQPIFWVDPILSKSDELLPNPDDDKDNIVDVSVLYNNPKTTIIKAPPQFGLSSLSHYLIKEAYNKNSFIGLYLDANDFKSHSVEKEIKKELKQLEVTIDCINFIILDSWSNYEIDSMRMLKKIAEGYNNIPLVVMQKIDETKFNTPDEKISINREFEVLHLLALPRGHVRKVVSAYNDIKQIGDEDKVLSKVVSDLDVLNIHRTPFNCITLLKVSEKYFDESPVNRTKMLEMVLFLLFNMDEMPTYKSKPDLKDCEYVLGRFCEMMIKDCNYFFTREYFIEELRGFCSEKLIDLEIDLVFDILYQNNIIVARNSEFTFRFTYWIFYFAAQRMHSDESFSKYIFDNQIYISFPELIEFYTGIDRNRDDALKFLITDIKNACDVVEEKVGLPEKMNPFDSIKWKPSDESISEIKKEIGEDVNQSKLPVEVKDKYADRTYDQKKAYNQTVQTIMHEYSLIVLMQKIRASSVALRNSDYVAPEIKRELLSEIMRSWMQVSKVLIAMSPILASRGYAAFEGQGFMLAGDWGETFEQRLNRVIQCIPTNIVGIFKNYLFSNKMGPLLYDNLKNETNPIRKHELVLFLIFERPNGWKEQIANYISTIHKNSFYLFDTFNALRSQYKYSFASNKELSEMEYLIKMGLAKHQKGIKSPGISAIRKISDKIIPKRNNN
ncbi:MAG: hypothetical protein CMD31_09860 [Flavobacteriales bacterium]|nr:hypothetical protein [Flavobacteriales bacterium]|tara:strand:+ start:128049 stop:130664 length:2616 start_codon:yes stop_codon:yes gene_type:complete